MKAVGKDAVCINKPMEDLAEMLWNDDPTGDFFRRREMDLSLRSLKHVEAFLRKNRKIEQSFESYIKLVLRSGAYLGEVVRKNSKETFYWLQNPDRDDEGLSIKSGDVGLWNIAFLWGYPDTRLFPMNKVIRYMKEGRNHSIVYFADKLINMGLREVVKMYGRPDK